MYLLPTAGPTGKCSHPKARAHTECGRVNSHQTHLYLKSVGRIGSRRETNTPRLSCRLYLSNDIQSSAATLRPTVSALPLVVNLNLYMFYHDMPSVASRGRRPSFLPAAQTQPRPFDLTSLLITFFRPRHSNQYLYYRKARAWALGGCENQ
jgi:hypothetical protein